METTTIALLVLVPLLVWRIYARLKRLAVRQQSTPWRHWMAIAAFVLVIAATALLVMSNVLALSSLGAGVLAGFWAGIWGIKLTRFERNEQGMFFTPHRYLGIGVAMLFVARVIYRGLELYTNSRTPVPVPLPMMDFLYNPLTLLPLGLLAGYFASYSWGLLRKRGSLQAATASQ
jgi:cytochrome b561